MITIEQVLNGVVIIHPHPTEDCMVKTIVERKDDEEEVDYMEALTFTLWEILGYLPSKHEERLTLKREKK